MVLLECSYRNGTGAVLRFSYRLLSFARSALAMFINVQHEISSSVSQVIRTIQAKGIQGLNEADKKKYVPPIGGGFAAASMPLMDQLALADVISNSSNPYGTGPYQYSQARIVADHVMTKVRLGLTGVVYLFSLGYHLSHLIALSIVNTTDTM